MTRTNIVLDDKLLKKAQRESGQKTITGTIHFVLQDYIKNKKEQKIVKEFMKLRGSGAWEGDLYKLRKTRV